MPTRPILISSRFQRTKWITWGKGEKEPYWTYVKKHSGPGLEARRSKVPGEPIGHFLGLDVHLSSWWQSLIGRQPWENYSSLSIFSDLKFPCLTKCHPQSSPHSVYSAVPRHHNSWGWIFCQIPYLETYISPEHFHLALRLVPGLQTHSVFVVLYQGNGISSSPSRKLVSSLKPPLLPCLLQPSPQMLTLAFRIHSHPLLQLLSHCQAQQ